jgi:hypothetical protein
MTRASGLLGGWPFAETVSTGANYWVTRGLVK